MRTTLSRLQIIKNASTQRRSEDFLHFSHPNPLLPPFLLNHLITPSLPSLTLLSSLQTMHPHLLSSFPSPSPSPARNPKCTPAHALQNLHPLSSPITNVINSTPLPNNAKRTFSSSVKRCGARALSTSVSYAEASCESCRGRATPGSRRWTRSNRGGRWEGPREEMKVLQEAQV